MAILAAVLVAAGLAAHGSEFPQLSMPLLVAGGVCAVLAAATLSWRRTSRR